MTGRMIDCCSLINLYTGWGGLTELKTLKSSLHICQAVFNESEYTREYGPNGIPALVPLDMVALQKSAGFSVSEPQLPEELEDYVNFATEIDDGEAQALAIAKHRGFALVTDDEKAKKLASLPDVRVSTLSTVDLLKEWSTLNKRHEERLFEVIPRISELARFRPPRGSPDCNWWTKYLGA